MNFLPLASISLNEFQIVMSLVTNEAFFYFFIFVSSGLQLRGRAVQQKCGIVR